MKADVFYLSGFAAMFLQTEDTGAYLQAYTGIYQWYQCMGFI